MTILDFWLPSVGFHCFTVTSYVLLQFSRASSLSTITHFQTIGFSSHVRPMCLMLKSSALGLIEVPVLTLGGTLNEYGHVKISTAIIPLRSLQVSCMSSKVFFFQWPSTPLSRTVSAHHDDQYYFCTFLPHFWILNFLCLIAIGIMSTPNEP